jgi:hypothetical protein
MPHHTDPATLPALPEARDVAAGRIYAAGIALLVVIAVVLGGLWLLYGSISSGPAVGLARPDPPAELADFRAREDTEFNTLGWIDRGKGITRIPVAEAMKFIAGRGKLPAWPAAIGGDAYCTFLEGAVPRSPAAINCAMGWGKWFGRDQ